MRSKLFPTAAFALLSVTGGLAALAACADSSSSIDDGSSSSSSGGDVDSGGLKVPDSGKKDTGASSSSSSSSSGSSGVDASSSSSSSSGGGSAPACDTSDFAKAIKWAGMISGAPPCDATCNPTTHCCFSLGGGGSSGLPIEGGLGGGSCLPQNP